MSAKLAITEGGATNLGSLYDDPDWKVIASRDDRELKQRMHFQRWFTLMFHMRFNLTDDIKIVNSVDMIRRWLQWVPHSLHWIQVRVHVVLKSVHIIQRFIRKSLHTRKVRMEIMVSFWKQEDDRDSRNLRSSLYRKARETHELSKVPLYEYAKFHISDELRNQIVWESYYKRRAAWCTRVRSHYKMMDSLKQERNLLTKKLISLEKEFTGLQAIDQRRALGDRINEIRVLTNFSAPYFVFAPNQPTLQELRALMLRHLGETISEPPSPEAITEPKLFRLEDSLTLALNTNLKPVSPNLKFPVRDNTIFDYNEALSPKGRNKTSSVRQYRTSVTTLEASEWIAKWGDVNSSPIERTDTSPNLDEKILSFNKHSSRNDITQASNDREVEFILPHTTSTVTVKSPTSRVRGSTIKSPLSPNATNFPPLNKKMNIENENKATNDTLPNLPSTEALNSTYNTTRSSQVAAPVIPTADKNIPPEMKLYNCPNLITVPNSRSSELSRIRTSPSASKRGPARTRYKDKSWARTGRMSSIKPSPLVEMEESGHPTLMERLLQEVQEFGDIVSFPKPKNYI